MLTVNHCIVNYIHRRGYRIDRPQGLDRYTVLLFKQPITFLVPEGDLVHTNGCTAVIYDKNVPQLYYRDDADYQHDAVHFYGDELPDLVRSLGLPLNRPIPVTGVQQLSFVFRDIRSAFIQPTDHSPEMIDGYMRILLYRLADARCEADRRQGPYYEQLVQVRQHLYADPGRQISVEEQSDRIHISPSRFQHLYKEYFGTSYVRDRIVGRLTLARQLLTESDAPVAAIAEQCGYESCEHFQRQFKAEMGVSPSTYRRDFLT